MQGEARELDCATRTAAVSSALCPGTAAAAPHGQEPPWPGAASSPWHRNCSGGGGGWGRGSCYLLRQKEAGQHFICNHLNVFAVFRIQNHGGGVPGRWVRRAIICSVDCTLAGGGASGSCWHICNSQPQSAIWVLLGEESMPWVSWLLRPWPVSSNRPPLCPSMPRFHTSARARSHF